MFSKRTKVFLFLQLQSFHTDRIWSVPTDRDGLCTTNRNTTEYKTVLKKKQQNKTIHTLQDQHRVERVCIKGTIPLF
uniref:Uncharacterized protein n=1 Tax=Anguilla anguilla TaxID=7936 RepID=A0A0E9WIX0_ANGAN